MRFKFREIGPIACTGLMLALLSSSAVGLLQLAPSLAVGNDGLPGSAGLLLSSSLSAEGAPHPQSNNEASIGSVTDTTDLTNGTTIQGNYLPPACWSPTGLLEISTLQRIFATCSTGVLVELNASTGAQVGSVYVGVDPGSLAFDPELGVVFIADAGGDVSIANVSSLSLVTSVYAGCEPQGIAVDAVTQQVFVSDECSGNVTVLSTQTDRAVANISLGGSSSPEAVAFNPVNQMIYVALLDSNEIAVLNPNSDSLNESVDVGGGPTFLAVNPTNGTVYVTTSVTGMVYEISPESGQIEASAAAEAGAVAYNARANLLYVGAGTLLELNGSTLSLIGSIALGSYIGSVSVDNLTGSVFTENPMFSEIVDVVANPLAVRAAWVLNSQPLDVAWNSATDEIEVSLQALGNLSGISGSFEISNTSLDQGIAGIAINNLTGAVYAADPSTEAVYATSTAGVQLWSASLGSEGDGTAIAFDPVNQEVFVAGYSSDMVWALNASTGSIEATISLASPTGISGPLTGVAYNPVESSTYVTAEGCLCGELPGNVTIINGSTNRPMGGIYDWSDPGPSAIAIDPATGQLFVADNYADLLWTFNLSTGAFIRTVPVGVSPDSIAVDSATGFVYVANSESNNISVIDSKSGASLGSIAVGIGPSAVAFDPASGEVYATNEVSGTLSLISGISPLEYPISFTESGLPTDTNWSVTLGESTLTSNLSSIQFEEPSGAYSYTIGIVPGWHLNGSARNGTVRVNNGTASRALSWMATVYWVSFEEGGLPVGTSWTVALNGLRVAGNSSVLSASVQNGTYAFEVVNVTGYAASPLIGSVSVNGSNSVEEIHFAPSAPVELSNPGLPGWIWVGTASVLILTSVVVALVIHRRRRKAPPRSESNVPETNSGRTPPA